MEKKKHPVLKGIAIALLVLLLLLLILAAVGIFLANSMFDKLDRTEITGDENLAEEEVYTEEPTVDETDSVEHMQEAEQEFQEVQKIDPLEKANISNILLIGSDRRGTGENGRSDTMILVTLNHDTGNIHLTSFMRAMYVCIPKSSGDTWGMLNASYSWGGPSLLIKTIENNFRIHIDNYVVVDFSAFTKAVDILGGVEIYLTPAEAQYLGWVMLPTASGLQRLDGARATAYSRCRLIDNDFKRTERQRKVITALMQKALDSDLESIMDLANQILPLAKTDMTNADIFMYAAKTLPMLQNPITQRMLPIENEAGKSYTGRIYVNGREMYKVDFETNIKALHEFMLS